VADLRLRGAVLGFEPSSHENGGASGAGDRQDDQKADEIPTGGQSRRQRQDASNGDDQADRSRNKNSMRCHYTVRGSQPSA
jgi:hypothetical protein